MRKTAGTLCMLLGALLLTGALLLYLYNDRQVQEQKESVSAALTALEEEEQISLLDGMSVKEVYGNDYCGVLYIPALDKLLPVLNSCTEELLSVAPGRYSGTPLLRNFVIGGHNNDAQFWGLDTLKEGDEVYFQDFNDHVWKYKMKTSQQLWPGQVDELCAGEYDLSLFNCTWDNSKRLVIRLNLSMDTL